MRDEIIPVASYYDKKMEFPWEIIKKAHNCGFMNANLPIECGKNKNVFKFFLGGLGLDLVSNVIICESIGYGCTAIGTAIMTNDLAATPLMLAANDDIKKHFLTRLIEEPLMAVLFTNFNFSN